MVENSKQIGARIKEILRKKNITQLQLASMVGMSEGHLSRILQGHTTPGLDKIEKIAEALEVPMAALYNEDLAISVVALDALASLPKEMVDALGDIEGREWLKLGLSLRDKNISRQEIELVLDTFAQVKSQLHNQ